MTRADPAQVERVRRLLAHEGAADSVADEAATAAGRIFDKLHAHLDPLIGAGVHALLVRSARLTHPEFPFLGESTESASKLRECLQAQDPAVAREAAAALFGTFFTLITTLIGERLTTQALRSAWPEIEATVPRETGK